MSANSLSSRVLQFWFKGHTRGQAIPRQVMGTWFRKNDDFDQTIRNEFEKEIIAAAEGKHKELESTPQGTLANIILFDQFPRNIYRNTAKAFEFDEKARALATHAIESKWEDEYDPYELLFVYLPFEHSEDKQHQAFAVDKFKTLVDKASQETRGDMEAFLEYAIKHKQVIDQFGRFPHRNAIVGRQSTPEEEQHIAQHGGF